MMVIDDCSKELGVIYGIQLLVMKLTDELLGNTNIKTQNDLFGKDEILK
jgi:hypothetical protein